MTKTYKVKVAGKPPFTMIIMYGEETAEEVCRAIFGDRFEWVK